jgi:signal peptidase I
MKEDITPTEHLERLNETISKIRSALKAKEWQQLEKLEEDLNKILLAVAPKRKHSFIRENLEVLVVAIAVAMAFRAYFFQPFKIPTSSMEDTLLINDHIIANKFIYGTTVFYPEKKDGKFSIKTGKILRFTKPKRGDVVIFRYPVDPKMMFIKRCIGLPGDTIEIKDKILYVNGKKLDEKYVFHKDLRTFPAIYAPRDNYGPVKVPEGHYFVMGDNRDFSSDSRFWGFLPDEYLRGKAWIVYWPPNRWRFIKHIKINIEEPDVDTKGNTLQSAAR